MTDLDSNTDDKSSTKSLVLDDNYKKERWTCQYTLALLGFIGISIIYSLRVNLSVAIVAMVGQNKTTDMTDEELACPLPGNTTAADVSNEGEFDWDESQQGLVLSSFYLGYALTNIIGGMAADRYGGRIVLGIGVLISSILTVLSPVAANSSSGLFIAVRVLVGVFEGVSFPAMNSVLVAWVLPEERSSFSGFIYAGVEFGTVVTLSVSGIMCNSDFLGGWPSVFYVFGVLGIIWSIVWVILIRDTPAQHPRISEYELQRLKPVAWVKAGGSKVIPWKSILTSKPCWGLLAMQFGFNWGFYTLLTELPTYLDQIQYMDLSRNGLISALPYLITWIISVIFTNLMTKLTEDGKISILNVRRLAMIIAGYLPMLGLIGMCFVRCNQTLAIVMLCITVGLCGTSYAGYICSHMDLTPRYAGTLYGITNTAATIPGFVSPIITGLMIEDNQTLAAWRNVFLLSSIMYAITTTIYLLTIRADVQEWNFYGTETSKEKPQEEKRNSLPSKKSITKY